MMESENITVSLYENSIPSFVESELDRLYENIYSSVRQFRISGALTDDTHTYVAQQAGEVIAVLLFRHDGNGVRVLNEQINLDAREIDRFAKHIFAAFPLVSLISFHAIRAQLQRPALPYQQFDVLEDIVLALPATSQEYLAGLGKSTRKNIKHHISRLKRQFPSMRFDVYCNEDISDQYVRDIVALNRARMAGKHKASPPNPSKTDKLIQLARSCGLVAVATVDGQVSGGAICCRIGGNYFSHIIAHDPAYDNYRLGTLCCYWTICECIERGGKEFHFLWGQDEYKYMLGGVQRELDDLILYRSRMHMLLNGRMALQTACHGYSQNGKRWLQRHANRYEHPGFASHAAFHLLSFGRSLKQFASAFPGRQK